MSKLLWNYDEYSVHINSIDNEHKYLFALLNDVEEALYMEGSFQDEIVYKRLDIFTHSIKKHFESEEHLLIFNFYPEFEAHKLKHTYLLERINEFSSRFKTRKIAINEGNLLFLKDWLVRHIILEDHLYANYYKDEELRFPTDKL